MNFLNELVTGTMVYRYEQIKFLCIIGRGANVSVGPIFSVQNVVTQRNDIPYVQLIT